MRLFTAVLLSDDARDHLDEMGNRFPDRPHEERDLRSSADIKWVRPENIHLTLKFLGEVDDDRVPQLIDRLRGDGPSPPAGYSLRASRLMFIPLSRGPIRVIAVSVGENVGPVQDTYNWIERACDAFGIPPERRAFLPHITLARCRVPLPSDLRYELGHGNGFTPGPWFDASQFALIHSALKPDGPEYRNIATFPAT